jgi:hypothetical protein
VSGIIGKDMDGVTIKERSDCVVITYDANQARKSYFMGCVMILFYIIWLPLTLIVTFLLINEPANLFFWIWLIAGYTGVILIPVTLCQWRAKERYVFSASELRMQFNIILRSKQIILTPEDSPIITFGGEGEETVYSINIFYKRNNRRKRVFLAFFLNHDDKYRLFKELKKYMIRFELQPNREGGLNPCASTSFGINKEKGGTS